MTKLTDHFDESARVTVAEEDCVSGWSVGLVIFGICLTLPSLYTGALTAENLGIVGTIKAVGLASVVLSLMSIPAAIVGAKTRLTSYLIIEFVFGRRGSNYVNGLLALTLLGWFAVTAGFFGETLHIAFTEMLGASAPVWSLTLISSVIILFTTIFGYKAIDRLSVLAVPLLILFLLYVALLSLRVQSFGTLLEIPAKNPDYFSTAVSAIIGSLIVGVVLMPDLSRYARSTKDCIAASILGNGIGNSFSMLIAVLPALATGLLDPMAFMIALGLLGSAFVILVFATWTTNSINLYSTTLAAAIIIPKTAEWKLGVACGIIGTGLAMLGITEHFISFLEWLGVLIPPVAGIYLADFFLLKRQDYDLKTLAKVSDYEKAALIAWILATALSAASFWLELSFTGIPSLDALLITIPIYLLCQRLMPPAYSRIKEPG
ncbi:MAG: cytosine permease [Pseudohongiella sp.]|nr:MAG: cytosine permease [Pseudohongiella sp.]